MEELEQAQTEMGREVDALRAKDLVRLGHEGAERPRFYTPDDKPCTLGRWTELFETRNDENAPSWRVGDDEFGEVRVSTVWIGIDQSFWPDDAAPLYYETMIFGGDFHEDTWRYGSRAAAIEGHAHAVRLVQDRTQPKGENHAD